MKERNRRAVPKTELEIEAGFTALIKKGRLALTAAGCEAPGIGMLAIDGNPALLGGGAVIAAGLAGAAAFDAHQYFWNNYAPKFPSKSFVKNKQREEELNPTNNA